MDRMKKIGLGALSWLGILTVMFVYVVIGYLLSIPYTLVAGWDDRGIPLDTIFFFSMVLPATLFLLGCLFCISRDIGTKEERSVKKVARKIFWWGVGILLIPILVNGLSMILRQLGLTTIGAFVFEWRFASIIIVPLAILAIKGLWICYGRQPFQRFLAAGRNKPSDNSWPSMIMPFR